MKRETRELVWNKFDQHCAYCGIDLEYKDMQVDHYWPKYMNSLGSLQFDLDHIDNLMPSCRSCNNYKDVFLPEKFREQMQTIHERIIKYNPVIRLGIRYGIVKIKPFDGVFYFESNLKETR